MCQLQPPDSGPPPIFNADLPTGEPIRVARKIRGRKRPNVFIDDRGFPDQSDEFDTILHNVEGGPILRRRKHPAPPLDDIDPRFHAVYDESLHGDKLRKELYAHQCCKLDDAWAEASLRGVSRKTQRTT